jgi:glutamine---fructose-6-phosphate transaminase (isomerizing)
VLIAARGTSDNVVRYAQHLFGRLLMLPVTLASPSLTTSYDSSPRLERMLVIGISQSGESPDVCAVVANAGEQGQVTVAITNAPSSPLASVAAHVIDICAGAEHSVAATKTYTASLAAVAALAVELAGDERLRLELSSVAGAMSRQIECQTDEPAEILAAVDRCAVVGRDPNYATAFEAALKLKELTGIAAEPCSAADFMHGPIAVLDEQTQLLAFGVTGPSLPSVSQATRAALKRGAPCLLVTDVPGAFAPECVSAPLVTVAEWLSPLVAILTVQASQPSLRFGATSHWTRRLVSTR